MLGNLLLAVILQYLYQNRVQELAYWMLIYTDQAYREFLEFLANRLHLGMESHLSQLNPMESN